MAKRKAVGSETLLALFNEYPGQWLNLPSLQPRLDIPERTLRRWLREAVERGWLESRGVTRGRQYRLRKAAMDPTPTPAPPPGAGPVGQQATAIFSTANAAIIARVRAPLYTRAPCSYRADWLHAYVPNTSCYLQPAQLAELHRQGNRAGVEMPAGTYARKIYNRLLIDLSYNSSRLEGNTYSLLDTEKLLIEGIPAGGKLDEEKIMILNHREAIRFLVDGIQRLEVNSDNIRSLHYLLADALVAPGMAGALRDEGVRISSSTYVPLEGRPRLERHLETIATTAARIRDPFEQSLFLLAHIAYLQGFIDVNKRTSRMAANIPLVRHNLVPLSFSDISSQDYASAVIAVYELNEIGPLADLYVWSYLRGCARLDAVVQAVGVDELRVLHRQPRRELLARILAEQLHGTRLDAVIAESAAHLPAEQRAKFVADIRYDLANLSPPRIAGLGITRQQLELWLAAAS